MERQSQRHKQKSEAVASPLFGAFKLLKSKLLLVNDRTCDF